MSENNQIPKIDFAIGGQALIEGVMMRSPSYVTMAVRKKDGSIKVKEERYISLSRRSKTLALPIIRGVINLFEMMILGMKAINFSADEYASDFDEKAPDPQKKEEHGKLFTFLAMATSFVISLGIALFFFKFIPLAITEWLSGIFPYLEDNRVLFNVIDGTIRIIIFVSYIYILSLFKSFHRIFEYHGAEHMAVHAYEKHAALTVENVAKEHPEHPRCGTSFLVAVFVVSILIYSILPRNPIFWMNLLQRIAVIPLIAGIGYEVLKWSAKHRNHPIMKAVVAPGLLTQKITTQYPDKEQMEVAIVALEKALELERSEHK